jgi:hypothetical protein
MLFVFEVGLEYLFPELDVAIEACTYKICLFDFRMAITN